MGVQELHSFLSKGGGKKVACYFTMYFQTSPCTTIVSDIENYPSAPMFCCSDDLAQLLPCTFEIWGLKIYQSKNKLLTGDRLINWSEAVNLRDAVAHVHRTSSASDLFNYIDRPVDRYLLQLKYCISLNDCQHETQAEPLAHVFCVDIAMCSYIYHKDVSLGSEHYYKLLANSISVTSNTATIALGPWAL